MAKNERKLFYVMRVKQLIEPVLVKLETIDSKICGQQGKGVRPVYYRNEDVKKIFVLSNNTIIKYKIDEILHENNG
ncbi:hypothetical protein [Flavobacterium sp. KBS0721]|uniref:hypothetical protein n=1 Tax=Flavobacterium sp. KBS0721 TaxID=1179672 RepID=UPI00098F0EA1|nr:hypothetical protein [Flavobacterium sp. KBS0721]QDW21156.1 hypothetical protein B0M43_0013880 [Flavobacterium sp. KBS0721]